MTFEVPIVTIASMEAMSTKQEQADMPDTKFTCGVVFVILFRFVLSSKNPVTSSH